MQRIRFPITVFNLVNVGLDLSPQISPKPIFPSAAKFDLGNYWADFDETITNRCSANDSLSLFSIW